ncbi:MAG TPA: sigma 54-interacting transcriptional regulator [Desulfuromonadales bacterium]|nr:sigma 54-interacting transcriptional regulator [Desulfuromonadales bacterium]
MDSKQNRPSSAPEKPVHRCGSPSPGWPSISVEEEGKNLIVQVELPDMSADQIAFSMFNDGLTIRSDRPFPAKGARPSVSAWSSIIGSSPPLQDCLQTVSQAAGGDANILISGETGTGKELFARAIHEASRRHQGPLVVVDCTSLPQNLVESLLFGHDKGRFTSAGEARSGIIRQAHTGTLFLDEVGELPLPLQKVFLRVLEEHRFRPLGAEREIISDFRLVAATNRNLDEMVHQGLFRADLLFRLKAYMIELPPLRERRGDIRELAIYHLNSLCSRYEIRQKRVAPDFFDILCRYGWPGNVRELINTLEHALFAAKHEGTLFAKHLPHPLRSKVTKMSLRKGRIARPDLSQSFLREMPSLHEFRANIFCQAENQYLQDLMVLANQDIRAACQLSGLSRSRLYALLKKHDIANLQ